MAGILTFSHPHLVFVAHIPCICFTFVAPPPLIGLVAPDHAFVAHDHSLITLTFIVTIIIVPHHPHICCTATLHIISAFVKPGDISWYSDRALWLKPLLLEKDFRTLLGIVICGSFLETPWEPEGGTVLPHFY